MAHVSQEKKKTVKEFVDLINTYPVIGAVNMADLPAKQLQKMRTKLRGQGAVLKMTKKRLMNIAFKESKREGIDGISKYIQGHPALIFTHQNPFTLYAELQKTKSKAPAKAGQLAPRNIVVPAGSTSFSPGPIIGQLGKFGIKTGIEAGKIAIKQDSVVAKEGDTISSELAGILIRLNIEPMEIGLVLTAVFEGGNVFEAKVLHIDTKEYAGKFAAAHAEALNVAMYAAYPSKDTVNMLLSKAHGQAKSLAVSQAILSAEVLPDILAASVAHVMGLASFLPDGALSESLRGQKSAPPQAHKNEEGSKEHKPKEEKKSEEDAAAGLGALFG